MSKFLFYLNFSSLNKASYIQTNPLWPCSLCDALCLWCFMVVLFHRLSHSLLPLPWPPLCCCHSTVGAGSHSHVFIKAAPLLHKEWRVNSSRCLDLSLQWFSSFSAFICWHLLKYLRHFIFGAFDYVRIFSWTGSHFLAHPVIITKLLLILWSSLCETNGSKYVPLSYFFHKWS